MKFNKLKLTKKQKKNMSDAYDDILEVLSKYPDDTPVFIIQGHHIKLGDEDIDMREIGGWLIRSCFFDGEGGGGAVFLRGYFSKRKSRKKKK